jgi:hypothetical protein
MKSAYAAACPSIAFASLLLFATGIARAEAKVSQASLRNSETSAGELQARDADTDEVRAPNRKRKDAVQLGAVVGVGFPRPLAAEAMIKVQRWVALGVEYSVFPKTTISDVDASLWALAGDLRVFPFRNGFFLGVRAGQQRLAADTDVTLEGQTINVATAVDTVFVNPRVGLLWTFNSGITLGIDAGLQFPVSTRTSGALALSSDFDEMLPGDYGSTVRQVRNVAEYLGDSTIPTLDLLRIGLLL